LPLDDPAELDAIATEHLSLWENMPVAWRNLWRLRTVHCLRVIPITGAQGYAITDVMRRIICAHLGLAILGLGDDAVADLRGITVYPAEFWVDETDEDELTGVVSESQAMLSGQAIGRDRIVLSWEDVLASRPIPPGLDHAGGHDTQRRDSHGYNVVIHEFTHHLQANRPHGDPAALRQLDAEYVRFTRRVTHAEDPIVDAYGAESVEEFLATAAEAFFQKPQRLRRHHPSLFTLLTRSFRFNPLTWDLEDD
jgi:Mlc titration factor MtfA (ptsG expression regulator)